MGIIADKLRETIKEMKRRDEEMIREAMELLNRMQAIQDELAELDRSAL